MLRAWLRRRASRDRLSRAQIEDLVEQILEECNPKQRAYALDPSRRFAALTSGRAGKTTGSKARLVIKALRIRRARLLFLAVTKDQAADLMWAPLKDLVYRLGLKYHVNETLRQMTLPQTGSIIRVLGADDTAEIEKLRGRPWHEVIIDEAASHKPKLLVTLIDKVIGPRLGDFDGCVGLIGTPGHVLHGLFYDISRRGGEGLDWEKRDEVPEEERPEWSMHRWTLEYAAQFTVVQATAWRVALETKRKKGWTDANPTWRREYLGEWCADEGEMMYAYRPHIDEFLIELHNNPKLQVGLPWNLWSPERKDGWAVLPKKYTDWRHAVGIDLGHGTAFALQVLAFSPSDKERHFYQRYEVVKRGMYARKIAELILGENLDHKKPGGIVGTIGGWPDAIVADTSNLANSILDELRDVYGIIILPADQKSKAGNVELTNGDLIDGRAHILEGSELAEEMAGLQWRIDDFGVPREPKHGDNACDGFIYARGAVAMMFEQERPPVPPALPRREDRILEDENRDFTRDQRDALMSSDYFDESAY